MSDTYSAGRALATGLSVFFRNLIPFSILAVVISSPLIAYTYVKLDDFPHGLDEYAGIKLTAISLFVGILMSSTLTYGVVMTLKGHRASIGACISVGLRRFFPVLGVGILLGVMLFAIAVGMFLIMVVIPLGIVSLIAILIVLGLVYAIYYVAIPASVIEQPGVSGALLRSRELTTGHRVGVFVTIAILAVSEYFVTKTVGEMILDGSTLGAGDDAIISAAKKVLWANVIITMVFAMIRGTIAAVTYYLLRSEKEGTSAEDLASVFD
jgi:hypothetical protein